MPNISRELNGKRILLVEGEPWTRNSLSLFLRVEGCSPHVAASAAEAMAALSAGCFDLIICEYWLPDMDGLSFLKLFGNRHPGTVKILTSSYMTDQAMGEAKWAGIHDVLHPPFTMDMLGRAFSRNRVPLAVQGELGADRKGNVGGERVATLSRSGRLTHIGESTRRRDGWCIFEEREARQERASPPPKYFAVLMRK